MIYIFQDVSLKFDFSLFLFLISRAVNTHSNFQVFLLRENLSARNNILSKSNFKCGFSTLNS